MKTQIVLGKNHELATRDFLDEKISDYDSVLLDIGAGDGKGSLRFARKNPKTLVIAIDSSFNALEKTALSSLKKPSRGGATNLICLYGNIRESTDDLAGIADYVRVLLPWGDLLEGIAERNEIMLNAISKCAKVGATIEIVVNGEIWKSNLPKHLEHLGEVTPQFFIENSGKFKSCGIDVSESYEMSTDDIVELDTTWTHKLMSSRDSALFIMAKAVRI